MQNAMKKGMRFTLGITTMLFGILFIGFATYLGGEPDIPFSTSTKSLVIGASALTGGVLTFGISRRLLTYRDDSAPSGE